MGNVQDRSQDERTSRLAEIIAAYLATTSFDVSMPTWAAVAATRSDEDEDD